MSKKQKRMLWRICGAAALFIPGMIFEESMPGMILLLAAYALIGWDILWRAAVNIRHGRVFDGGEVGFVFVAQGQVQHGIPQAADMQLGELAGGGIGELELLFEIGAHG